MSKLQRMSEAEKQIMEIIWSAEPSVTTSEIISRLPVDKSWKQNTVVTFLARLMDKGMVSAVRIGKANHYAASITQKEYRNFETKQFIQEVHRGSVSGFISALCDNGDLTREDIEDLMRRLPD